MRLLLNNGILRIQKDICGIIIHDAARFLPKAAFLCLSTCVFTWSAESMRICSGNILHLD